MEREMRFNTEIGNIDIINYSEGKQAQCVLLNSYKEQQGNFILKVAGEGKNFTQDQAELLVEQSRYYLQELSDAGVRLPTTYDIKAYQADNEWRIMMVDEFIPAPDMKKQLSKPSSISEMEDGMRAINHFVGFLHDLPDGHGEFKTKVMGDFKPDNFVYYNSELVFIDYFAPKRFVDRELYPYMNPQIDTFDRKSIEFLCGDRRGQISRVLALIKRDHPFYISYAIEQTRKTYQDMPIVLDYTNRQIDSNFAKIDAVYQNKPTRLDVTI